MSSTISIKGKQYKYTVEIQHDGKTYPDGDRNYTVNLFLTDNAAVTHGWKLGEIGDHYTNGDDYKVELAGFLSNNKIIVKGKSYDNPGKLGNKFYGTL